MIDIEEKFDILSVLQGHEVVSVGPPHYVFPLV